MNKLKVVFFDEFYETPITESADGELANETLGAMIPQIGLDGLAHEDADDDLINHDTEVHVPRKARKLIAKIATIEKKIAHADKLNYEKGTVIDLKRELLSSKNELKAIVKTLDKNQKKEVASMMKSAHSKVTSEDIRNEKNVSESVEDGEVVTEVSAELAAVGSFAGAVALFALTAEFINACQISFDALISNAHRNKFKNSLKKFHEIFIGDKAPEFYSLKKEKIYVDEDKEEVNKALGVLKKWGLGKDQVLLRFMNGNEEVCGIYLDKRYSAFLLPFGRSRIVHVGSKKAIAGDKVMPKYSQYAFYYRICMALESGIKSKGFDNCLQRITDKLKAYSNKAKLEEEKKESVDELVNILLIESAIENSQVVEVMYTESELEEMFLLQVMEERKQAEETAKSRYEETHERRFDNAVRGNHALYEHTKQKLEELRATMVQEKAGLEAEMKPVVDALNSKGFKVKYASPGHTKLRKKEDQEPDGVYKNKLYSDARIMFDGKYNMGKAPKYWHWRDVDGCDYLDITPEPYNEEDGTPDEAFTKWKSKYMESLKNWVSDLGKEKKKKEEDVKESFYDLMDDMLSQYE